MNIQNIAITCLAVIMTSVSAHSIAGKSHTDFAKVTSVNEIVKTIEHRTPREACWTESVAVKERVGGHRDSYTSTIVGSIIGGAIGNAVGHKKKNKRIGTAVGAILGGSIGHDIGRDRSSGNYVTRYKDERRCETHYDTHYEEKVVGYDVWYRYGGEEYKTRMQRHPGKRIKVRVKVDPIGI